MLKQGKLELTWVGKYEEKKIEPRILIEDKSKSYGDPNTENMLIHGDNLIALKALEQDFAGKIKCIYIDPPFNTGARINADGEEIGYEDGIEHSEWLDMIARRLRILKELLSDDGAIFVHLDDNESDYCKIIMDEIFGRKNYMNRITVISRSPSAFSTVNPGVFKAAEHILFYAKKRELLIENACRVKRTPDYAYNKWIVNPDDYYTGWKFITISQAFEENNNVRSKKPETLIENYNKFIVNNAHRICRLTAISDTGAGKKIIEVKKKSIENPDVIYRVERSGLDDVYIVNGQQISFYIKNVRELDGELAATSPLTDVWSDIAWEGIAYEGSVTFKKGKKPEKLIKRCLELITKEGDIILDSFLGSGTTAAVAHKMNRKWIGIEMGPQCYSHCLKRLKGVVDGSDQSGISKIINWQGGGGFKFYELAEPLLIKNSKLPIYSINPSYTFEMMAEAICKIEGFKYKPIGNFHGKSSENRFIHVTNEFVNSKYVFSLVNELEERQSLLIYCTKMQSDINLPDNVEIKKIPKDLLNKCSFESEGM